MQPLKYDNCPLYGLKSKKMLRYLLGINDPNMMKQSYVASLVDPYINNDGKPRLIEPPRSELKSIQKQIKKYLSKIEVPSNVFSGIRGRSYADNALLHTGEKPRYLFKIDLTAFFPSITRDAVYRFFLNDMFCSPDVSNALTNFTTVDLRKATLKNPQTIYDFLTEKNVTCYNHLISGAPTSPILSYLVNHRVFDEMQTLADSAKVTMTIYVDDVTFSCEQKISRSFKPRVFGIIERYGYQISEKKVKSYTPKYPKLVTGVIIDSSGNLTVKNSLRQNIIAEHKRLREDPSNTKSRQRLRGLITAARQIKKDAFPTIYRFALEKASDN